MELAFYEGDWVVYTNQIRNPYLVHVLEPMAADAFFRWNFFDGILMRKEYFSPYVFEEEAQDMLENDPELKAAFEEEKKSNEEFAGSAYQQLNFLYMRSKHYENTHNRYPVGRWTEKAPLPLK